MVCVVSAICRVITEQQLAVEALLYILQDAELYTLVTSIYALYGIKNISHGFSRCFSKQMCNTVSGSWGRSLKMDGKVEIYVYYLDLCGEQ